VTFAALARANHLVAADRDVGQRSITGCVQRATGGVRGCLIPTAVGDSTATPCVGAATIIDGVADQGDISQFEHTNEGISPRLFRETKLSFLVENPTWFALPKYLIGTVE